MNFLSINTAGRATIIAINYQGKKIYKTLDFSRHSENLFPLLLKTLDENNLKLDDFDCFGGVVGPGSFTGIRIGLSVIKGFAFAKGKKVVAINSLEVLAYNLINSTQNKPIVAVINAGSGMLYHQVFEKKKVDNNIILIPKTQPRLDKFKYFTGYIRSNYCDNVEIVYNHNNEKGECFVDLLSDSQEFSEQGLYLATQAHILNNDFTNSVEITPLYLRVSSAEQLIKDVRLVRGDKTQIDKLLVLEGQDDQWDLPWTKVCIEQSFDNPNYRCYLLESKDDTLGFVSLNMLPDEAEVLRVVVLKKYRQIGVGEKMLDSVINTLRTEGVKTVFLEVNNYNYPAYNLYQKLGFLEVGRRPDYYPEGQSAVVMRRDL